MRSLGQVTRRREEVERDIRQIGDDLRALRIEADAEVTPKLPADGPGVSNEELLARALGQSRDGPILERIRSYERELRRLRRDIDVLIEISFDDSSAKDMKKKFAQHGFIIGRNVSGAYRGFVVDLDHAEEALEDVLRRLPHFDEVVPQRHPVAGLQYGGIGRMDPRKVFVVYGRDQRLVDDLFGFLRAGGLDPTPFERCVDEAGGASRYVGDIIHLAMESAQAIVVLFSPDEEASLRPAFAGGDDERGFQPRPNVLFEAGLAMGQYPERTLIVAVGDIREISDLGGRHIAKLDDAPTKRKRLLQRLEAMGCAVDLRSDDWMRTGSFAVA